MTTAWTLIKLVVPYLLPLLGLLMVQRGTENIELAKKVTVSPTDANIFGPGQKFGGMLAGAAGLTLIALQHHKAVAAPAKPTPPAPSPLSPANADPLTPTLIQGEKQITDELNANIAALTAKAQEQIGFLRKVADSRKGGA